MNQVSEKEVFLRHVAVKVLGLLPLDRQDSQEVLRLAGEFAERMLFQELTAAPNNLSSVSRESESDSPKAM